MAGTGVVLSIKVDFPESELKQELVSELKKIEPGIKNAMEYVASVAKTALQYHVQADVYDKFEPKEYIRTGAIIDMNRSTRTSVSSSEMTLRYLPDGSSDQWQNPVSGDALIERIESGQGYEWRRKPGPRPFWGAFVDEMIDSEFARAFDSAMAEQLGSIYEGGTTVTREGEDGDY